MAVDVSADSVRTRDRTRSVGLEVPRFLRGIPEVVVEAVDAGDGRSYQLGRFDVVQAGDIDRIEGVPAGGLAVGKRPEAATLAEAVMDRFPSELIFGKAALAGQEPERICLDRREPVPSLAAHRTVALDRALGEVDVGLEADGPAVAASLVRFLHGFGSPDSASDRSLL